MRTWTIPANKTQFFNTSLARVLRAAHGSFTPRDLEHTLDTLVITTTLQGDVAAPDMLDSGIVRRLREATGIDLHQDKNSQDITINIPDNTEQS